MNYFQPPYPAYDPTDKSGFSYETVVKRWPIILTTVIDHIHRTNHDLTLVSTDHSDARVEEGKHLIELISKLKYEMGRDRALVQIPDDGEADVDTYNAELAALGDKNTWFSAPWLFAECYLYRLLRSWFSRTTHWRNHDPFQPSKEDSFKGSSSAIFKLASTMQELKAQQSELKQDPEKIGVLFLEMIQMSLWGNATDLSLLTNLTHEDIRKLQSVGKEAQAERKEFVLRDDAQAVWEHLRTLRGARVDFVLDNCMCIHASPRLLEISPQSEYASAGFELYTDLVFADFLVTYTPYVSQVVFHPKSIPWFVSDVTPPDFAATFDALLSASFFPPSSADQTDLTDMVTRWKGHLASGAFTLSVPQETPLGMPSPLTDFWTTPYPYWDMRSRAPALYDSLTQSGLVIFKGDLNYRKLTGDIRWPASTPFATAIGPLAGSFPLLSLRTNKADVVVGVDQAKADELDAIGEKWRVNGKYALISFVTRAG